MRVVQAFQSNVQKGSRAASSGDSVPAADRIQQSFRLRRLAADERERVAAANADK